MGEIHRIRRKFILAGTLAVIIIVVGALGVINTITYVRMQNSVFSLLTMISENGGQLPSRQIKGPPSWIEDPDWYNDSPESIYQIRYFSILMSRQGDVEAINLAKIASFSRSEAVQAVKAVVESNRDKGIFKKNRASYSFMVTPVNEDHYRIVIMDSTKDVAAVESFARYSVRFGIGCILVYVLILYALCNLIIQPFVHNIENQKRFITNAGHELKTPIAIISANTEVLEMTQGKNEWTANILAQVRRGDTADQRPHYHGETGRGEKRGYPEDGDGSRPVVQGNRGTVPSPREGRGKNSLPGSPGNPGGGHG
jgi:two-component system, OmpR family, sensor histidine kinase CiaH